MKTTGWSRKKSRVLRLHNAGKTLAEIAEVEGITENVVSQWIGNATLGSVATARHATRCPTCGGMVYMPCMACKLRSLDH